MITALDHIQLAIPPHREDDARTYYGGLLSLSEIEKPEALKQRGGVWFSIADGHQLHLGVERDFRPSKKAHPCFVIGDELEQLAELLINHGYDVKYDELNPPTRRFYTHDVFGNRLEFANRMSGN